MSAFLALGLLAPIFVPSAQAQNAPTASGKGTPLDFSQLATQKLAPARLQMKSLGKGWQRLTVENNSDDSYLSMYGGFRGSMFQDALANAGIGVYFTKGQSVTLGGETFLIAYRVDTKMTAQDIQALFQNIGGHGDNQPDTGPRKFPKDATLLLSLLNLRTIGSLKDITPFDAKRDVMGPADITAASNDNLEALGRYVVQISQGGYSEVAASLRDARSMRQMFTNYFHARPSIFMHPGTMEPYRTNAEAFKVRLSQVRNKSRVVTIYEGTPGTDGKYGTVFLDGHVERVPKDRWKAVRAVLPQKPTGVELRRLSDTNLRQLRFQLVRFTRVSGGSLPRMQNAGIVRNSLTGRLGLYGATYFTHPGTGEAYRPNTALSGKNLRKIVNPASVVAFYEVKPDADGKRTAIFLDGHIERVATSNWNKVRSVAIQEKQEKPASRSA